jgi:CrcB protein
MKNHLLAVATGGALGAVCRHLVGLLCISWLGAHAALGTWLVNVAGCLLIGLFVGLELPPTTVAHSATTIGFLGALTTFSSFGLETVRFVEQGQLGWAAGCVAAHLGCGLAAVVGGIYWGRVLAV